MSQCLCMVKESNISVESLASDMIQAQHDSLFMLEHTGTSVTIFMQREPVCCHDVATKTAKFEMFLTSERNFNRII